jgi:hypothetical protein
VRGPGGFVLGAALALLLLIGAGGCGARGEDSEQTVADTTTTPVPARDEAVAPRDSGAARGPDVVASDEDPFAVYGLGSTSDVRTTNEITPAWLVNGMDAAIVVKGEAGAGQVVLDTIPAADSILVRIETRADSVRLEALTITGRTVGSEFVRSDGTSVRVAFPR